MTAMRRAAMLVLPFALLAACDGGGNGGDMAEMGYAADSVAVTGGRMAAAPPPAPGQQSSGGATNAGTPDAPEGMLLAYSYAVGFDLPARNVAALKDRHEAECRAAGPQLCLVLGGSVSGDGEDYVFGNLNLRAEPGWLEGFRAGLAQDAEESSGRISSQSTSTEDLTRNIVDTEARLQAQETLRERLIALLERPSDEIGDLLAVERELARVQGELDSARSQLRVMRTRVDMSRLDLSYAPIVNPVSSRALAPVEAALRNFLSTLAGSLATVITIIAAAIPFVLILIPLIVLVWRGFRRWRGRRRPAA
jgi:hypothetical protein